MKFHSYKVPTHLVVEKIYSHEEKPLTSLFHPKINGEEIDYVLVQADRKGAPYTKPSELSVYLKDGRELIFNLKEIVEEDPK